VKKSRANKGQFSVIAALLVSVILVSAVISTYTLVRHAPIQDSPKVLTAIGEMNADIKQILDFTVGYYGSILKVTGNSDYAKNLTTTYLSGGLVNIARSHPEWNPSFNLTSNNFSTSWFMPESFSMGNLSVTYSLESLGIEGVKYETSSALEVTMLPSDSGVARILVTRDNAEPELGLSKDDFWFYNYTDASTWELITPPKIVISSDGVYNITLPEGINPDAYSVQVEDNRGLMVSAFYSPNSVASESKIPHYIYAFDWESTGMLDIYEDLSTDTFAIELLQNGTLKWLGQSLDVIPDESPIPPVCIKAFRVNATINGVNQEVPFQVEDWASDYMIPLGIAGNESIFSNTNMIVFLVNDQVSAVTVWWDGNDTAIQTPYAWDNKYFNDDVKTDPDNALLSNGYVDMYVKIVGDSPRFVVTSDVGGSESTAEFLRINDESPVFWADTAYVIYDGVVRDIVQQEPEWGSGISKNLYVDGYDWTDDSWSESGSSPYLDDDDSSYIYDDDNDDMEGWFSFQDIADYFSPAGVKVQFECRCDGDEYFDFQIDTGTHTFGPYAVDPPDSPYYYGWVDFDLSDILDTVEEVNNAKLQVRYRHNSGGSSRVYIRKVRLDVVTCPNVYSQIVLTLPANSTYYTYSLRTIFVDSTQPRTIDDLSVIQLSNLVGSPMTENGTIAIYPNASNSTGSFYDCSPTGWDHHWSQFVSGNAGAGVMFTNSSNEQLYAFDNVGAETGAVVVDDTSNYIEVNPVELDYVSFNTARDLTWYGAVVTFDGEPIYHGGDDIGLWVMVEHPPRVALDDYETTEGTDIDYVNTNLSNEDSSADKGTHSAFAAQKYGPDTIMDKLTEVNTSGSEQWISPTGYEDPQGAWQYETNSYDDNTNTYASIAVPANSWSGYIELTHSAINCDNIRYWVYRQDYYVDMLEVDIYDGAWVNVYSGSGTWQQWANVSFSETSVTGMRFRFHNNHSWQSRSVRLYEADFLQVPPDNYELDLEIQWTHADFDEANEELCIYLASSSGEGLGVEVWTGSGWDTLIPTLNVGDWTNVTVSSYLTSEEFTIRFVGTTETGDTTQDYWTIDATLLHCWT